MARQPSLFVRLLRRPAYAGPSLWARLSAGIGQRRMEWLWLVVTVIGVVHLGGVLLVPNGVNRVFDWRAGNIFAYQTMFAAPDVLGFPPVNEREGFLLYKIYAQDGQQLDGAFPDPQVRPRVRYDRWAAAGYQATGNFPDLHASILAYLVNQLPEPPLRIEMYAARWLWDRNRYQVPWRGFNKDNSLDLKLLGVYNGLTKVWTPARGAQ